MTKNSLVTKKPQTNEQPPLQNLNQEIPPLILWEISETFAGISNFRVKILKREHWRDPPVPAEEQELLLGLGEHFRN